MQNGVTWGCGDRGWGEPGAVVTRCRVSWGWGNQGWGDPGWASMGGFLGEKVNRVVKGCELELLSGPSYQEPWRVPEGFVHGKPDFLYL